MSDDYRIHLDVAFEPLAHMDIGQLADETEPWFNQTLCEVNDAVVRLGVVEGEFHWHQHDEEDEFFYVVEGRFIIELENGTVDLGPRQGVVIPRGTPHFPRAPERTVLLMVERKGVNPTGD